MTVNEHQTRTRWNSEGFRAECSCGWEGQKRDNATNALIDGHSHAKVAQQGVTFLDGTGYTPGTEVCKCDGNCEFPCFQRIGIAPACEACGCAPFEDAA